MVFRSSVAFLARYLLLNRSNVLTYYANEGRIYMIFDEHYTDPIQKLVSKHENLIL